MIKKVLSIGGFVLTFAAGVGLLIFADDRAGAATVGTDGASGSMLQWLGASVAVMGLLGVAWATGLFRAIVGAVVAYRQSAPAQVVAAPPAAPAVDPLAPPGETPQGPAGS